MRGRCLPYGEGITYWPVVEVLRQLEARPADEAAAAAIESLLGESDAPAAADEIAWAVRKTLEQAAAERPLVVVLDDIHWGEPRSSTWSSTSPTSAATRRSCSCAWPGPSSSSAARPGRAGSRTRRPCCSSRSRRRRPTSCWGTSRAVDDPFRDRIRGAAGGNPLFLEEMVAMAHESGGGEIVVPPTIRALLAARLDQLEPSERAVLQRGAVEGEVFHRGAVEALAPDEGDATTLLLGLVRKELVRPERTQIAGDEAFRFRHLLLRDAAYDALPKSAAGRAPRAPRRVVRRARRRDRPARRARRLPPRAGLPLPRRARPRRRRRARRRRPRRLTAAGRGAWSREDPAAAANLLGRAAAVLPDELDLALELDLVDALVYSDGPYAAARRAASIAERAAAAGDRVGELCARIEEGVQLTNLEPEGATERLAALVEEALPVFEAAADDLALWTVHWALAQLARDRLQMEAMRVAAERSLVHARRLGLARQELMSLGYLTAAMTEGPTPAADVLAWVDELAARGLRQSCIEDARARMLAVAGRLDEARSIVAELRAGLADRGATLALMRRISTSYEIELLAGDHAAAAAFASELARLNEERREWGSLSTVAGQLAQALYGLDRLDEAEAEAARSAELGASDDVITQMLWRQVKAKVLARRGEHAEAERLAPRGGGARRGDGRARRAGPTPGPTSPRCSRSPGKDDEAAAALEQAARPLRAQGQRRLGRARPRPAQGVSSASESCRTSSSFAAATTRERPIEVERRLADRRVVDQLDREAALADDELAGGVVDRARRRGARRPRRCGRRRGGST